MNEEEQSSARRRVALRRGRSGGGFSASQSVHTETYRGQNEPDEVDDVVDMEAASNRIRAGSMTALPPPVSPQPNQQENAIRARLDAVARSGNAAYTKEHRLKVVQRLLQRGYGLDFIAAQLQCSISTVEKDRAAIRKQWREEAKVMNIDEMIGEELAGYKEIEELSMRIAGASGEGPGAVPIAMRLAAMRTNLAAKADKTRQLTSAGVFDVLRYRRNSDGEDLSDVQLMMQRTRELIEAMGAEEQETPVKAKRIVRKAGGFKAFSHDDRDASSSDNEIQEL